MKCEVAALPQPASQHCSLLGRRTELCCSRKNTCLPAPTPTYLAPAAARCACLPLRLLQVVRDTWHVTASFNIHNKPVSPLWQWTAVPQVPVEARAYLPSTSYVKIRLGNGE